ncbi:MAG: glutamate formiminotransferase [Actinomycetota bacterium]|nr:glutamate formiminotransferase [Actinomycetota bacterium]
MGGVLECVANVSEGRRPEALAALAAACSDALLDVHADADHHRSVFTLAGREASDLVGAALRLARTVDEHVDLHRHSGVHPRLGALDVVPFVALEGAAPDEAVAASRAFGEAVAGELDVPVFLYDGADPAGRSLPSVRREAFVSRAPDFGPAVADPRLGAVCVGARPPLVAVNCELAGDDVSLANAVARAVRERDGGLPGVRALGFPLPSRGRVQVSMNLVALSSTGVEAACSEVRDQARRWGSDVVAIELVGLLPATELARCSDEFLSRAGVGPDHTVEARLRAAGFWI